MRADSPVAATQPATPSPTRNEMSVTSRRASPYAALPSSRSLAVSSSMIEQASASTSSHTSSEMRASSVPRLSSEPTAFPISNSTCGRRVSFSGFIAAPGSAALEHPDERQVPVLLRVVQPVADHELVRDGEPQVVDHHLADSPLRLVQERAQLDAGRVARG